jgi:hypothetical protein
MMKQLEANLYSLKAYLGKELCAGLEAILSGKVLAKTWVSFCPPDI